MPRRVNDLDTMPVLPKKKAKIIEDCPSLDVSFCDDEALPPGIIFTDVQFKKWRIGKPIGRGSFGRIYLASDDVENEVTKQSARYVVKIEPHTNGPLFVELHCMIRTAQVSKVKAWRQQNKLKRIGMPLFIANGSFTDENTGTKYRFLVLPRYDIDLQKIIARTKILDLKNVLILSLQILDVLEYLHNHGYTHSDIKSSNLMLGFDSNKFVKATPSKNTSFQKESKQVVLLPGKHRKAKTGRSRPSNYYDDEDFTITQKIFHGEETVDGDDRLANVKKKLRKILSDRDYRTLHRHHSFNLRQLSNYVNYEDLSSACSDRSYQKLLDDYGNKTLICVTEKLKDEELHDLEINMDQIYKEAILSQSNGQIYLLDYGLATKFLDSEGNHKDFVMDARKAHDGTLEYSSRDSHVGAHSRRSDLETLAYNMLDWLTATLPWKTKEVLAEPDLVHALKKNFMGDIKTLLKTCFKTEFYPQVMEKYLQYITSLDYTEKPDYDYCRNLFRSELIKNGIIFDREISLNFAEPVLSPVGRNKLCYSKRFGRKNTPSDFIARNGIKKASQRENVCSLETDLKLELLKQTLNISSDGMRKPCVSRNFFISDADLIERLKKSLMPHDVFGKKLSPKILRSKKTNMTKYKGTKRYKNNHGKFGNFMGSARQFTWAEILAGNPEDIIRKERHTTNNEYEEKNEDTVCKYKIRKLSDVSHESNNDANIQSPLIQKDYLHSLNPTYAMKEVLANLKKKVSGKAVKEQEECPPGLEGYTPAMIKLYKSKEKREAREKLAILKQNIEQKELKIQPRCTRSMSSFLTENNLSKLIRKKNADNDNGNVNTVVNGDSHAMANSSERNNQIRSMRAKSSTTKKNIKDEIIYNEGKTTETDSHLLTTAFQNCNQTKTRRAKNVVNKKYSEDYIISNIGKTLLTNSCVASQPRDQIRSRRAKSVANKKKIECDSSFGNEKSTVINSCVPSKTCDHIRTRRAKSVVSKINIEDNLTNIDDKTPGSNSCVDFKICDQIGSRRNKNFANIKDNLICNDDKTMGTNPCVASNIYYQIRTRNTKSFVDKKVLKDNSSYDDAINNNQMNLRRARSCVNKINGDDTSNISSTAIKSDERFRTLRTRTIACKIDVKKATTTNNCNIKKLQTVSKIVPADTGTANGRTRTRSSTRVAIKNSNITNLKTSHTKDYLECSDSKNMEKFKKRSDKSVMSKKELKVDMIMNNSVMKSTCDAGAASNKYNNVILARITRSAASKEKTLVGENPKKPTTSRKFDSRSTKSKIKKQ